MNIRWSLRSLLVPGIVLYLGVLAAVHTLVSHDLHIVFTGVGTGTALLGIAAIVGVIIKVREYMETTKELVETTDTLVETVNGGLEAAAKSHLQDNEMFISLATRVDRLEREKADEVEAKQAEKAARHACEEALTELREWVVGRLDEIGEGRSEPREGSV